MSKAWLLVLWLNYGSEVLPVGDYATEADCIAEAQAAETELHAAPQLYEDWTAVCCRPAADECP